MATYLEERDKRRRNDGNQQYVEVVGLSARYLDDHSVEPVDRDPLFEDVVVAFIDGGS